MGSWNAHEYIIMKISCNRAVDFPDYPSGYGANDVAKVYPHKGREESKLGYRTDRSFEWCFYVKE